jgi:hypothetical protein
MSLQAETSACADERLSDTDIQSVLAKAVRLYAERAGEQDGALPAFASDAATATEVMVTVTATKDGVTRTSTVPVGHSWAGPAPTHVPSVCYPDDPPEEPEPTIPPICEVKPWLCDDF